MTKWIQMIDSWRRIVPLRTFAPASELSIGEAGKQVAGLPEALEEFYKITNGLSAGSFKILPVVDAADIKRTWDSVQRANDAGSTKFLARSSELLKRFIVFAEIGPGRAAAFDRTDGSIWYEEDAELRQTNLSLEGFIETVLREIAEPIKGASEQGP